MKVWFLLGECQDLTPGNGVDDCSNAERWRDNPMEALKGLPIVTEKRDLTGRTLSTDITQYELRKLYEGRDGRAVRQAVAVATRSYVYDTSATATSTSTTEVNAASRHDLVAGTNGSLPTTGAVEPLIKKTVPLRSSSYALIEGSSESDFFGNQVVAVKRGCVEGCNPTDETLTQVTIPAQVEANESRWLFRTTEAWTTGSAHGAKKYGYQRTSYDVYGNPQVVTGELSGSVALLRGNKPTPATPGEFTAATTTYDAYGNPIKVEGANGRCSSVNYDSTYAQLPVSETVYREAGCKSGLVMGATAYDRGLGLVTIAVDINGQPTKVDYDGFGRTSALYKPSPNAQASSSTPSVKIEYYLAAERR